MHKTTWVELSSEALRHNANIVRRLAPKAAILAMVKANGYGHGASWVAECLHQQVDGFAVARLSEAQQLRAKLTQKHIQARIVQLGTAVDAAVLQTCSAQQLDLIIHDLESAKLLAASALPQPITVWLKMNIGMNRLGMSATEFTQAHQLLSCQSHIADIHHMSHFSDAEDTDPSLTAQQSLRLSELSASLSTARHYPLSMANSAAIIAHPNCHYDWVRPGIMLYGDDPTQRLSAANALKPVMTFKAKVLAVRGVDASDGVGYNRRWRAKSNARIATVAAGYADGYPRHAPDGTPVLVNGLRAKVAGRVSMDLMTIDVSQLPQTAVGDEVTLWGEGLPAAEVGSHCGTISYELFTRITDRVERVYF
ncbi:MAG: alanine racemase [Zhongshania sp.]|uniref:alanine racemase n=1 Tax=Zhongshania sp. TaxID=1971902 RepID=UPI00260F2140|nr:alanine racemase [Zhongshania sp.]MDF1691800.1 alanine racemase [Zhongshania sp.]